MNAGDAFRYRFAAGPCGAVAMEIGGAEVMLRPSGALWLAGERLLVAADLHLEKGSAFAARGQMLPPYDTRETLARLAAEAGALRPRTILLLGDSFHDGGGEGRLAPDDFGALGALARQAELLWITGNHDLAGVSRAPGVVAASWKVSGLNLVHEPALAAEPGEVAGHLHPCARIRGKAASVRRRCFITDGERLILPAFGAFAGGLNVRAPPFRPLFRRRPMVVALGASRAHAVAWDRLGAD